MILLAGLAGLLAGALSMAAGEYVSVRSRRELLDAAAHQLDAATLRALRQHAAGELAWSSGPEGYLSSRPSGARPRCLTTTTDRPERTTRPARRWSGPRRRRPAPVSWPLPAVPPFRSCRSSWPRGPGAILTASVLVGAALFATGATAAVLTGGPLLRRGLRQLGIGAAAAAVTYTLGRAFGATVG